MPDHPRRRKTDKQIQFPQLHDVEWLRHQYVTLGKLPREIAEELGCSAPRVFQRISESGLRTQGGAGGYKVRVDRISEAECIRALEQYYAETGSVNANHNPDSSGYVGWARANGAPQAGTIRARGLVHYLSDKYGWIGPASTIDQMPEFTQSRSSIVEWLYLNGENTMDLARATGLNPGTVHNIAKARRPVAKYGPKSMDEIAAPPPPKPKPKPKHNWNIRISRHHDRDGATFRMTRNSKQKMVSLSKEQALALRDAINSTWGPTA